jgi:hypothetical protein
MRIFGGDAKSDEFISLCMAVGDAALQFITSDQVNLHRNIYVIVELPSFETLDVMNCR